MAIGGTVGSESWGPSSETRRTDTAPEADGDTDEDAPPDSHLLLLGALRRLSDALDAHRVHINRLNVYPVPDGDTGTNMASTVRAAVAEVEARGARDGEVLDAVAHGSLMGARGNSGVILSQVIRGLSRALAAAGRVDAGTVAAALAKASEDAHAAVMRPVEGTILTVAREAAAAAVAAAKDELGTLEVLERAREAAAEALRRTPELLPVLADAGVVDAGGVGYVLLLDSLLSELDGRPLPPPGELEGLPADLSDVDLSAAAVEHSEYSDLRYEVMFLLEAEDDRIPAFRDVWAGVGDSIVVVGGEGLWNCHIHTDDIGAAIEAALDVGRPRAIRVTDLAEQVEEQKWVREASETVERAPLLRHDEPAATAVVAVANGAGVQRIFHSLGAHRIVVGGQSANPSTAEILGAVREAPSDAVVVLPNNKNVVPVAVQAAEQAEKDVRVVPTRNLSEGLAALVAFDPQAEVEANVAAMAEAASQVLHVEVCRAVRDAPSPVGPVRSGDWIALGPDGITAVSSRLDLCCIEALDRLVGPDHEIVTVVEGEGATAAVTRKIVDWISEEKPGSECEVHHGGQPLYPYVFAIE